MNTYKKFCPNVFVAKCETEHAKGDTIHMDTKYGEGHDAIVFNLIAKNKTHFFYSVVRADGFNVQEWAKRRANKLNSASENASKKSNQYWEAAKEGQDFLRLGEPIKIGHHSEKRHRALINRNHERSNKAMQMQDKADGYAERAAYWEGKSNTINLSMPESLEYFEFKLEKAENAHADLKSGAVKPAHSYSLTYAKKEVNELKKKFEIAKLLWAENQL